MLSFSFLVLLSNSKHCDDDNIIPKLPQHPPVHSSSTASTPLLSLSCFPFPSFYTFLFLSFNSKRCNDGYYSQTPITSTLTLSFHRFNTSPLPLMLSFSLFLHFLVLPFNSLCRKDDNYFPKSSYHPPSHSPPQYLHTSSVPFSFFVHFPFRLLYLFKY